MPVDLFHRAFLQLQDLRWIVRDGPSPAHERRPDYLCSRNLLDDQIDIQRAWPRLRKKKSLLTIADENETVYGE